MNIKKVLLEVMHTVYVSMVISISLVAAFLTQTVNLDDTTVKFEIWDTAGQENILFIMFD